MINDPVQHSLVGKESDDAHLAAAFGAEHWFHLINLTENLSPAAAGNARALFLDDQEPMLSLL
jgi:hypothetical protein